MRNSVLNSERIRPKCNNFLINMSDLTDKSRMISCILTFVAGALLLKCFKLCSCLHRCANANRKIFPGRVLIGWDVKGTCDGKHRTKRHKRYFREEIRRRRRASRIRHHGHRIYLKEIPRSRCLARRYPRAMFLWRRICWPS